MPSPVGHALGGLAIAWGADLLPGRPISSPRVAVACMTLAALPDIDLLLPVVHRTVTHSLGAVVAVGLLMIVAAVVTGEVTTKIALTCVAAFASHLLFDWLAVDQAAPRGIQLLWPFSREWFISGWDVFRGTERRHFFRLRTIHQNFITVTREIAILAPVVGALWLVRVKALTRLAAEMPRGDHPA
jgi:LexA-binding, inner membrane-associated putative hydrolase